MKLLRFGSSLIALGAFMAILLILSPALSYAQQSDADIVRSLDGAMYYYAPYGFAPKESQGLHHYRRTAGEGLHILWRRLEPSLPNDV